MKKKKRDSVAMAQFMGTKTSELLEALRKNPQNKELTMEIFDRLCQMKGRTDRGSNLAEVLMAHGHTDYVNKVFKAVEVYAKAGCYAPANFEGMILARKDWRQDLVNLMISTCGNSRSTQSVLKNLLPLSVAV